MHIHTGLFEHMVLQRDGRNRSRGKITGETEAAFNAPVVAHVRMNKRTVPGFAGKVVGQAKNGKFTAALAGLPVGGPYTVELSIGEESLTVGDVLVGDVWIAAGQSNMQGCGLLVSGVKPHALCRAASLDDQWRIAEEPINDVAYAIDQVHADLHDGKLPPPNRVTGAGPAVAFIQEMQRVTGVPQGVIASSHGGTSMEQWDPGKKSLEGKSLYGATCRRFEKSGGAVAGVIWYQGESETHPEGAKVYVEKMKQLVAAFRRDFASPRLPIAMVQIGRFVAAPERPEWNMVQEMQRQYAKTIPHLTVVPAIDLQLDDLIHIGGRGQLRLGKRLAGAMLSLVRHPKAGPPPIALRRVQVHNVPARNFTSIVLTFDHVVGDLHAAGGRPAGFVVLDADKNNVIFDIELEKNRVILHSHRVTADVVGRPVFYGYGNDPYCNIVDDADRSLPALSVTLPPSVGKGKK